MSNVIEYKDIMAFHPGCYIAEMIDDMGISQEEFAARMGTSAKNISTLVNGQSNISNDMAKKLSIMTGTSTELWLNLQNTFDEKTIEIEKAKDYDRQRHISSMIDYSYFVNNCGLEETKDPKVRISNLCKYFCISDLEILSKQDFLVSFRMSKTSLEIKNIINSRAWLQTALNMTKDIETKPYDAKKLKHYLPELREMTIQKPDVFLPRMKEIFSECGVAFVMLPHLKNSGVNGAVKWISKDRAVLAMSNRGLDADKFWFSLFHEIKHIFQQKIKTVFIRCDENDMIDMNRAFEDEADKFASNYLIPESLLDEFEPNRYKTDEEIKAFAEKIGIHPGIVAGRLQHDGIIPNNRCSKLKEKYIF